ncbi:MAG: Ulp1 family isopeptidase [Flectobacillus sp.]|nr:Ulp1 family isopeptidase [Flectobacillus sp.]
MPSKSELDLIFVNLVDCDGVKVINICSSGNGSLKGKNESCILLSAVLTMILHSFRLNRHMDEDFKVSDNIHYRLRLKLLSNIHSRGLEKAWPYEEVLQQLRLCPQKFQHQSFSDSNFNFGQCVAAFITPECLEKPGLRCIGTIDLVSCVDSNSLQSNLQILYQRSIKDFNDLDNSHVFVNVKSSRVESSYVGKCLKSLPHTFILNSSVEDHCFQMTAALYISKTGTLKVVLITRSFDTSVLGSNYFYCDFMPSEYKSSTPVPSKASIIPSELSTKQPKDTCILIYLPGGFTLSGLVLMKSKFQLPTAKLNAYTLSPELWRKNEYDTYGLKEKVILQSIDRWLSRPILNSVFGLVSNILDKVAKEKGIRHTVLSTLFFHYLMKRPTSSEDCLLQFAPDFDIHDTSVNAVVHIPINYPENYHWIYAFLHITTRTVYLMDSVAKSTKNNIFIQSIFDAFLEADFNRRKHRQQQQERPNERSNRSKSFLQWEFKVIPSPAQGDGYNCGIFTIMNMVRVCQLLNRNEYPTKAKSNATVPPFVLENLRHMISQILFQNKPVTELLDYVNKFPNF